MGREAATLWKRRRGHIITRAAFKAPVSVSPAREGFMAGALAGIGRDPAAGTRISRAGPEDKRRFVRRRTSALVRIADSNPKLRHVRKVPTNRRSPSFNHLVGNRKHTGWDVDAERLGSLEIDDQLEPSRSGDRQVDGLLALENAASVDAHLAIGIS